MHVYAKITLLWACLSFNVSFAQIAIDPEIIVFEIAKDKAGSVIGWDQNTWSRAAWDVYGKADAFESLKERFEDAENFSVKIIPPGYRYIVYTRTEKSGVKKIGIPMTKDPVYFVTEQARIEGYVATSKYKFVVHELNGFNEEKELYSSFVEMPVDIEQLPSILEGSESKEGTFACGVDGGVGKYSIKKYKEGVFVIRGEGKGSMTKVDVRKWQKSGLSDEKLKKKWSTEVDRSMRNACEGMKRGSSKTNAVIGALETYMEKQWQEKLKECEDGARPKKDCEVIKSEPAATGVKG